MGSSWLPPQVQLALMTLSDTTMCLMATKQHTWCGFPASSPSNIHKHHICMSTVMSERSAGFRVGPACPFLMPTAGSQAQVWYAQFRLWHESGSWITSPLDVLQQCHSTDRMHVTWQAGCRTPAAACNANAHLSDTHAHLTLIPDAITKQVG